MTTTEELAMTAKTIVRRDGTVLVDGLAVGEVRNEWLLAVGYLWVARDLLGHKVGTGATRREALAELLEAVA